MDKKNLSTGPRAMRLGFATLVGLGLSGCTMYGDPYGYSGVSVGVGYDDGYYDPYYDDPYYYGWYDDYYYPGTGYYVYDRHGYRHRWSDHHRRYWVERRSAVREIRENWEGYTRDRDGTYRDQRRQARHGDGDGRRGHGDRRGSGYAGDTVRSAAEAARDQRGGRGAEGRSSRRTAPPAAVAPRRPQAPAAAVAPRRAAPASAASVPQRAAQSQMPAQTQKATVRSQIAPRPSSSRDDNKAKSRLRKD